MSSVLIYYYIIYIYLIFVYLQQGSNFAAAKGVRRLVTGGCDNRVKVWRQNGTAWEEENFHNGENLHKVRLFFFFLLLLFIFFILFYFIFFLFVVFLSGKCLMNMYVYIYIYIYIYYTYIKLLSTLVIYAPSRLSVI